MPRFTYAPSGMSRATRMAICSRLSRCMVFLRSSGRLPEARGPCDGAWHFHEAMHEDSRRHDVLGIQLAGRNDLVYRGDGQLGAVARRRKEAANAGARRSDALSEVALRHQFELDLAGAKQAIEDLRVDLTREAADDVAHAPGLEQCGEADFAVAGVVVDDGEVAGALRDERVDELCRLASAAEAADHYRRAVRHVAQRGFHAGGDLVDHRSAPVRRLTPVRCFE